MDCDGNGIGWISYDGDCHCYEDGGKCDDGEDCEEFQYVIGKKFITACLTEIAAEAYISRNKHNLKEPFVYVDSLYGNPEMIAVRNHLMEKE